MTFIKNITQIKALFLFFAVAVAALIEPCLAAQGDHPQEILSARFLKLAERNPDVNILTDGSYAGWQHLDLRSLELGIICAFSQERGGFRKTAFAFADAVLVAILNVEAPASYWMQDHGAPAHIGGPAALLGNAYETKNGEFARWILARGLDVHLPAVEAFYEEYFFTAKHFFKLATPAHCTLIAIFLSRCDAKQIDAYLDRYCAYYKAKFDAIPDGVVAFKTDMLQRIAVERGLIKKHNDVFVQMHPEFELYASHHEIAE